MNKCPECGKAHRKFPQDCYYWAKVNRVITDDTTRRDKMVDYIKRNHLDNDKGG